MTIEDYHLFIKNIKVKTGIDLSMYKETQMKRRLTSLRDKRGFSNFNDYFQALGKNNNLLNEFVDRITINVSEFFRNRSRWDVLKEKIIPLLGERNRLKILSAACSTGEEPYSLSMILNHYFPHIKASILATDIDDTVLKKAEEGIYTERSLKEMPDLFKSKYLVHESNLYHVRKEIKESITFSKFDLLKDHFDDHYDLIICRNVMIYFTDEAKDQLYQKFSKALKTGGILFVGSTEQIFNPNQYQFETVDNFFYRKKI